MKPTWDNAPPWAKFLARDRWGWAWYETEPTYKPNGLWCCMGQSAIAVPYEPVVHHETLEERPT